MLKTRVTALEEKIGVEHEPRAIWVRYCTQGQTRELRRVTCEGIKYERRDDESANEFQDRVGRDVRESLPARPDRGIYLILEDMCEP